MAGGGGALYSIVAFILNRDSQWREGVEHCISVEFLLQYGDEGVVRSLQVSHSQLTQSQEHRYESPSEFKKNYFENLLNSWIFTHSNMIAGGESVLCLSRYDVFANLKGTRWRFVSAIREWVVWADYALT